MNAKAKADLRYVGSRLKAYRVSIAMLAGANVVLIYFGMPDIALWFSSMTYSFIMGSELVLYYFREYCRKHGINPNTFRLIADEEREKRE